MGGGGRGGGGKKTLIGSRGGRFPFAFVLLVFLKGPWLNWTYWPTNRGSVPTESRDRDNIDPRLRGGRRGGGGEREREEGLKEGTEKKPGKGEQTSSFYKLLA